MLSRLSIRDIVLIERLDIDYAAGLSVLTGETGAGKSILLDAFALALGSRGDASLVRNGAEQGQVTAAFDVEPSHPAMALLAENGIGTEDGLILRRVQLADGRTRALAEKRAAMMAADKIAEDLRDAHEAVSGDRSPISSLSTALRRLERRRAQAPALVEPAVKALDAAVAALHDADGHLEAALRAANHDPRELDRIEERLFALRAAGRKFNVAVDNLAALSAQHAADLAALDAGAEELKRLEAAARDAEANYTRAAAALSAARKRAAARLDKAVTAELKPLKLERARFSTNIETSEGGPDGIDRVEFWVQTNPGTRPGPLMKVASGGELARFLLALKVVLADCGSA